MGRISRFVRMFHERQHVGGSYGNGQEALGLHLVDLVERGMELPAPSNIADISASDGHTTYVSTDMNAYRRDTHAVKKMLSIPAWLAKAAEENNISLSKVLQDALKEQLHLA